MFRRVLLVGAGTQPVTPLAELLGRDFDECVTVSSALDALIALRTHDWDMMVLCWSSLTTERTDLLLRAHTHSVSTMILCDIYDPVQTATLLNQGATDVLPVSADPREVRARIRAHLRRILPRRPVISALELDRDKRMLSMDHVRLRLSPLEARIMALLMSRSGQIVPYASFEEDLWGQVRPYYRPRLRVMVCNLRRKMHGAGLPLELRNIKQKGMVLVSTVPPRPQQRALRGVGMHSAA